MKTKEQYTYVSAGILIFWMFLIFVLSSQSGLSSGGNPPLSFYVERKGAHVFEYFVLALLSFRFFRDVYARPARNDSQAERSDSGGESAKRVMFLAAAFALAYAATDEFHQLFVPGREGKMTDVLIDGGGVALFICTYIVWMRYQHKISK